MAKLRVKSQTFCILKRRDTCQHDDAVAGEAEAVAEEVTHALDVVDGASQLAAAAAHAGVGDADEDGALLAAGAREVANRRRRPGQGRQGETHGPSDARHAAALRALDGALAGGHGEGRAAVLAADRRRGPSAAVHGEAAGRRQEREG